MKAFIFTFALISCLLLSQGFLSVESRTTMTSTTSSTTPPEVLGPFTKAIPAQTTTKPMVPGQQCTPIGSACSVSDECCSRRCSTYRGRCAY